MSLLPNKANSAGNTETLDDRTPIPANDYQAHIVKAEFKATKKKNGHRLALSFKVLEGDYIGRMVFTGLNLDNPNPVAVEMANKEMNSICQAIGKTDVEDSDELLQCPMTITVTEKPASDDFPPSNEITAYSPPEGAGGATGTDGGGDSPFPPDDSEDDAEPTQVEIPQGGAAATETPAEKPKPAGDSGPKLPWEEEEDV